MLLSNVRFGATLAYSPRGKSDVSRRSADFVRALKQNKVLRIEGSTTAAGFLARRMADRRDELPFAGVLADAILVPLPRSGLHRRGALWPAFELAQALKAHGFGAEVRDLLRRTIPLRKAATAAADERPTARQHFDSMAVDGTITGGPIVLVDDVVTRGATMLGAASRLHARLSGLELFGFAAARTISDSEVVEIFDPVMGSIDLRQGQTFRRP
jgi:predicted amidophosphoribosyltransferase